MNNSLAMSCEKKSYLIQLLENFRLHFPHRRSIRNNPMEPLDNQMIKHPLLHSLFGQFKRRFGCKHPTLFKKKQIYSRNYSFSKIVLKALKTITYILLDTEVSCKRNM
jgi:hypothetical protein